MGNYFVFKDKENVKRSVLQFGLIYSMYSQNSHIINILLIIFKTISIDENPKDSRNGFRSDSASWTSRDELGSAGDLIEGNWYTNFSNFPFQNFL